eukprot:scaffold79678_cov19-Tisochrysis_lutea.AAC.4
MQPWANVAFNQLAGQSDPVLLGVRLCTLHPLCRSTSECTVVVQDNTTGDDEFVGSIDVKVQDVLKCQDLSPLS